MLHLDTMSKRTAKDVVGSIIVIVLTLSVILTLVLTD